MFTLVLASTSPYRQQMLSRFGLPFSVVSPAVDETPAPLETPEALVVRLSELKARAGAATFYHAMPRSPRNALIIGADQVADYNGVPIGKPGSFEAAHAQLQALSGKTVIFRTGLALYRPDTNVCRSECVNITTTYRTLSDEEITAYLTAAKPFNCAGSVRSEDLGITLFDSIQSDDPTALIGLPLIALARLMREQGANPLMWK
jgi:septum formation protein